MRDEATAPWRTPTAEPVESPELEIRRCLRRASVLVAEYAVAPEQRLMLLGGARHWATSAIDAIDRLASETERAIAVPDTVDITVPDQDNDDP